MEDKILKKAKEGGYKNPLMYSGDLYDEKLEKVAFKGQYTTTFREMTIDHLFWQALEKNCRWEVNCNDHRYAWEHYALRFHQINLTQSWSEAVRWLEALISK